MTNNLKFREILFLKKTNTYIDIYVSQGDYSTYKVVLLCRVERLSEEVNESVSGSVWRCLSLPSPTRCPLSLELSPYLFRFFYHSRRCPKGRRASPKRDTEGDPFVTFITSLSGTLFHCFVYFLLSLSILQLYIE